MSVTLTKVADSDNVVGRFRSVMYDMAFDNSYPAGGEAITPANVGLSKILGVTVKGGNAAHPKLIYGWDTTNNKLLAFFPTGGATAAPTSLANPIVTTGSATASAVDAVTPNITPGQGVEVGATADLSSITLRVEFIGY